MTRFTVLFLAAASAAATLAAVSADTVKLLSPNDLALMTDHHHHQEHNEIEQKNEASDSFESLHLFGDPIAEASDSLGHYGPPPSGCLKDEQAFQIQGVPGMVGLLMAVCWFFDVNETKKDISRISSRTVSHADTFFCF